MKRLIIIALLLSVASASAGPVLLGTFGGRAGSGATELHDPRAQLGLLLTSSTDTGGNIPLGDILFSTNFLGEGESGDYWFDARTDSRVVRFGELLTNGLDDFMGLVTVWSESVHVGIRGDHESFFLGRDTSAGQSPDFIGYRLDSIRLIVRDVTIEPFVVLEQEGLVATFDFAYEFYGVLVPDPATFALLVMGSLGILACRVLRFGFLWRKTGANE